ncbi:MAG: hypothetical protein ACI4DY_13405 [Monoglobaceae bacterium]
MATTNYIIFIISIFLIMLAAFAATVFIEWINEQSERVKQRTERRIAYKKSHSVDNVNSWVDYYFSDN